MKPVRERECDQASARLRGSGRGGRRSQIAASNLWCSHHRRQESVSHFGANMIRVNAAVVGGEQKIAGQARLQPICRGKLAGGSRLGRWRWRRHRAHARGPNNDGHLARVLHQAAVAMEVAVQVVILARGSVPARRSAIRHSGTQACAFFNRGRRARAWNVRAANIVTAVHSAVCALRAQRKTGNSAHGVGQQAHGSKQCP